MSAEPKRGIEPAGSDDRHVAPGVRNRVRRLKGQAAGIERMLEEGRACEEILVQVASLKQAANSLAAELLQTHIEGCVRESLRSGDEEKIESLVGTVKSALKHM